MSDRMYNRDEYINKEKMNKEEPSLTRLIESASSLSSMINFEGKGIHSIVSQNDNYCIKVYTGCLHHWAHKIMEAKIKDAVEDAKVEIEVEASKRYFSIIKQIKEF